MLGYAGLLDGRRRLARALIAVLAASCLSASLRVDPSLRAAGTHFVRADGTPFAWRGITAFRLLEFVAHNRESQAAAYLDWAASEQITVVRVLSMAHVLFALTPAEGEQALPRLLELARARGLVVEVVALADTASYRIDLARHVQAVGNACAASRNCVIEIANEPYHPTQSADVHDHSVLRRLRGAIPSTVPVSLGTLDDRGELAAGDYVTWHSPRDSNWPERMREGVGLVRRYGKPVIADEPMGAADDAVPGRRDNVPEHFAMAARLAAESGVGTTFHYEGGLQARLPTSTEMTCLKAWMAALTRGSAR
ncbi:MAG TPA: hypothetical protein VL484_05520 [Vicinamibacterales bacterium]|jgi:hypothetical protein|nr:hypothetical protein [Vicinamibacterales bacterium]